MHLILKTSLHTNYLATIQQNKIQNPTIHLQIRSLKYAQISTDNISLPQQHHVSRQQFLTRYVIRHSIPQHCNLLPLDDLIGVFFFPEYFDYLLYCHYHHPHFHYHFYSFIYYQLCHNYHH